VADERSGGGRESQRSTLLGGSLDTAIELWFKDGDGLSAFTLAYASFKCSQISTHIMGPDGFGQAIDRLTRERGAHKSMANIANFLKHADRDPDDSLSFFHPDLTVAVIGLSTLLYKNLTDSLSLKMQASDSWTEATAVSWRSIVNGPPRRFWDCAQLPALRMGRSSGRLVERGCLYCRRLRAVPMEPGTFNTGIHWQGSSRYCWGVHAAPANDRCCWAGA